MSISKIYLFKLENNICIHLNVFLLKKKDSFLKTFQFNSLKLDYFKDKYISY